jgi:alkaline phosphatase
VLLGGGARHFLATRRDDGRDLFADYAAGGYAVVRTADELARSNASRLLGVFSADHMPFELDRTRQNAGGPSLATMAAHALGVLSGSERGFVLQIEAGRVDHANHKNDMAASLHDMMAADEALAVALRYVDAHPDTLLLMASDHATGGGVAYGVGTFYRNSTNALERIEAHDASFDHIVAQLRRTRTRGEIIEIVRAHTGVEVLPNQAEIVERALRDGIRASIHMAYNDQPHNSLAHVLYGGAGGRLPERLNVNFSTGQHSAGVVPVAAYGAGSSELALDMIDNTALFGYMLSALGAEHENPVMSEEAARQQVGEATGTREADSLALAYGVHS